VDSPNLEDHNLLNQNLLERDPTDISWWHSLIDAIDSTESLALESSEPYISLLDIPFGEIWIAGITAVISFIFLLNAEDWGWENFEADSFNVIAPFR